jgi:hypothetical protein
MARRAIGRRLAWLTGRKVAAAILVSSVGAFALWRRAAAPVELVVSVWRGGPPLPAERPLLVPRLYSGLTNQLISFHAAVIAASVCGYDVVLPQWRVDDSHVYLPFEALYTMNLTAFRAHPRLGAVRFLPSLPQELRPQCEAQVQDGVTRGGHGGKTGQTEKDVCNLRHEPHTAAHRFTCQSQARWHTRIDALWCMTLHALWLCCWTVFPFTVRSFAAPTNGTLCLDSDMTFYRLTEGITASRGYVKLLGNPLTEEVEEKPLLRAALVPAPRWTALADAVVARLLAASGAETFVSLHPRTEGDFRHACNVWPAEGPVGGPVLSCWADPATLLAVVRASGVACGSVALVMSEMASQAPDLAAALPELCGRPCDVWCVKSAPGWCLGTASSCLQAASA